MLVAVQEVEGASSPTAHCFTLHFLLLSRIARSSTSFLLPSSLHSSSISLLGGSQNSEMQSLSDLTPHVVQSFSQHHDCYVKLLENPPEKRISKATPPSLDGSDCWKFLPLVKSVADLYPLVLASPF